MPTTHTTPNPTATTSATASPSSLRTVLRINAGSSLISGVAMAAIPDTIDDLLDTGRPGWIRLVGLGLVVFALVVAIVSTFDRRRLTAVTPPIIAGDVGWVAASVVTVLLGWYSGGGVVAVLAMALMVDTFAVLQWRFLRQIG